MTIETKYNIGDEVWRLSGYPEEPEKVTITGIRLGYKDDYDRYRDNLSVFYNIDFFEIEYEEEDLFPTKEELLESL